MDCLPLIQWGRVATLLLVLLAPFPIYAQDNALGLELTPFGAYRFGGTFSVEESSESYELQDSSSFGLIVNWRHSPDTTWEMLYSKQQSEAEFSSATVNDSLVDIDLQILQLGGTYQFEGENARPYLAATLGGTHASARSRGSNSDTFLSGSIGVGVLISPNSRVGLRLEARAYGTLTRSSTDLLCQTGPVSSGCAVRIEGDLLSQVETFAGVVFRF